MSTRRQISWSAILFPLAAVLAVIVICSTLYLREAEQIENNLRDRESRRVENFAHRFGEKLQSVVTELRVLADGDGLRSFITTGNPSDLDRLIHRAVFISHLQPDYDKIRYIDEHGQEISRVNWNGAVVPHDQLQNKGDRPFFQRASALEAGQIFISAFDLNVEHGQIEQPLKPTIRLATPIFDAAGHRRGIYIVNYLGANLIENLQQSVPQFRQRFRLLNEQGYWIKAAQPGEEWGFMFPDRAGLTMAKTDPDLWKQIESEPSGQVRHAGGLFTWYRLVPGEVISESPDTLVTDEPFLVMAGEVSADEWSAYFATLRQIFFVAAMVPLLLVAVSWRFFEARQRAEETLVKSQKMFQGLFENSPDAIIQVDQAGRIIRINSQTEALFGFTRAELAGQSVETLMPERYRARHGGHLAGYFTAPHPRAMGAGLELFARRKDGSEFPVDIMLSSLETDEGTQAVAVIRDITGRKQVEERIQKLNLELKSRADQLEASNKELEAFSYSVSHDLRAPLRHVDGFVEMLSKNCAEKLDDRGRRYLGIIAESARQMGELIDDLLVFSRMGRVEMKNNQVDMNTLVRETVEAMKMDLNGRHITWKINPLPDVKADASMVRQVWANLIGNAVKYTRPRDPATIEIDCFDPATTKNEYVFFVRDNGVGFDMQYVGKLFGVFQRLHRASDFEGTGIGLANVRRIVTRHGGRTWAEAKVDQGATFFFSLPQTPIEFKG